MNSNKVWLGIILIIFGLLLSFLGAKFFWFSLIALLCVIFTTIIFILYFILQAIIGFQGTYWSVIVVVVCGCILGISIGICLKTMVSIFFIGIGGFMGYVVAMFLYNTVLNHIHSNPTVVFWVTVGVLVLLGMIIGYKFLKVLFIFTTSFFGSYLVIRALSFWIGGFPSESLVIDLINSQEWDTLGNVLTPVVYAYISGWVILTGLSMWYQFHTNKDKTDDDFRGHKKEEE